MSVRPMRTVVVNLALAAAEVGSFRFRNDPTVLVLALALPPLGHLAALRCRADLGEVADRARHCLESGYRTDPVPAYPLAA